MLGSGRGWARSAPQPTTSAVSMSPSGQNAVSLQRVAGGPLDLYSDLESGRLSEIPTEALADEEEGILGCY
jgi:hypothetical protein